MQVSGENKYHRSHKTNYGYGKENIGGNKYSSPQSGYID